MLRKLAIRTGLVLFVQMACAACMAGVEKPARVAAAAHPERRESPRNTEPVAPAEPTAPDAHLDELRICYTQAQLLNRATGPSADLAANNALKEVHTASARLTRAEHCLAALGRFAQAERGAATAVEVAPRHRLSLPELRAALEDAHRAAQARLLAVKGERERVRARWLRVLYGDRRKVFNAHPDEIPDYDGKARGPLPASVLPRWQYQGPDGRAVIYLFKGNRLVSKTVSDPRRS